MQQYQKTMKLQSKQQKLNKLFKKKEEEKNKKQNKTINDYTKLIQSMKKQFQKLALENEILKKKLKKTRR